jgi:hypothetical protein
MLFGKDGVIVEGNNQNEASWRVQAKHLELLNERGEVHGRFKFEMQPLKFIHTDEPDTKAFKGQYMIPAAAFRPT